jgi:hypothetical protein
MYTEFPSLSRVKEKNMSSIAVPKPPYSIGALQVLVALVIVFVLGAASGYLIRPSSAAAPAPAAVTHTATACPAGTHVVVWYTARTWACVADATS